MSRFTIRAATLLQIMATVLVVADPCNNVTADEIDGYLSQHDSVLEGLGDVFVDQGRRWDVDPRLVIAIAQQETSLGTAGACSRYHNPFNWFYCASSRCAPPGCTPCADADPVDVKCERSAYESWERAVSQVMRWLSRSYLDDNLATVERIAARYCQGDCGNWIANVKAVIAELGGDPNALGFRCSCGNDVAEGGEECDGSDDRRCPGRCNPDCTCSACGNDRVEAGEACDGTSDPESLTACPAGCRSDCTCPCGPRECWNPCRDRCDDVVCRTCVADAGCTPDGAICEASACGADGSDGCAACSPYELPFQYAQGTCANFPTLCGTYGPIACAFPAP